MFGWVVLPTFFGIPLPSRRLFLLHTVHCLSFAANHLIRPVATADEKERREKRMKRKKHILVRLSQHGTNSTRTRT